MSEEFLTTKEVAQLLNISEARVRQLVTAERLKTYKRGRDHLFLRTDIEAFASQPKKKAGRPKKR